MTQEDVIRMAREAGWDAHHAEFDTRIERFATLVAAAEREACANVCDEESMEERDDWAMRRIEACARVIRSRGTP